MSKHQKFSYRFGWLGFSSDKPNRFNLISNHSMKVSFTKGQFIKMLNSQRKDTYIKAYHIICFIDGIVGDYKKKNRNRNSSLSYCLRSPSRAECDITPSEHYAYFSKRENYRRTDKENSELFDSLSTFTDELQNLKITNIPRDFYEANLEYSTYLHKRFRNRDAEKRIFSALIGSREFSSHKIHWLIDHISKYGVLESWY